MTDNDDEAFDQKPGAIWVATVLGKVLAEEVAKAKPAPRPEQFGDTGERDEFAAGRAWARGIRPDGCLPSPRLNLASGSAIARRAAVCRRAAFRRTIGSGERRRQLRF